MTATIISFPTQSIIVKRTVDCWAVRAGDHGWDYGDSVTAKTYAAWLSGNLDLPVRVIEVSR